MEAIDGVESPGTGRAVAFDFPAGGTPARVPRRIRRRLLEARSSLPSTVEEIEAKLGEAHLRRQHFHEWLSSKARAKPRSPLWSSQEEDPGQRLEAKLYAAEQKRLSLLAKTQMRLARLDELRQVVRTGVEMRFEKELEELGTKVESRVQQAEANRMRLLKAHMQRRAAVQERKARSLLQRVVRENKYKESVNSAILLKHAAAEKKRMGLLEAEMRRASARVTQARCVAKSICHQRESERRRIIEELEIRFQRAKRQRAEYLKQRGNRHSSAHVSSNKHGDLLSRKLARCWTWFVRLKKTTFSLAKAFETLEISENSTKTLSFEQLSNRIESDLAIQTVKALLQRFETRLILSQPYSSSDPENIDHLLKHTVSPKRRTPSGKATRSRGPVKKASTKEFKSSEENKLSRYLVRVVLCAYMILGHPKCVFSVQGKNELELQESAENFIKEFESLIKITLDGPISPNLVTQSFPDVLPDNCDHHQESTQRHTFRSQLEAFDTAWSSYLHRFVVWKVKDATSLEEDLVRAACQLELSMMQTCELTAEGQTGDLSNDMRAIQKEVTEEQKLLREKVIQLSGDTGIARLESSLSDTRSKLFEDKESGRSPISDVSRISSPSTSSSPTESIKNFPMKQYVEDDGRSSHVISSLFGNCSSLSPNISEKTRSLDTQSTCIMNKQRPMENEQLVNEIIHEGVATFTNNNDINGKDGNSIKAKIKETIEKAFWDGIMESLKEDEPNYSRIVVLVKEVRDELFEMAPQSWKQEILDRINLDILSQVLKSGIQDTDYIGKILEYALVMLQKLSAPAEEDEMKKVHRKLLSELTCIAESTARQDWSFVLATVKGLRFVLDEIQMLKKEISKARMQLVEPIIRGSAGLEYLQKAFTHHYGPPSSSANSLPLTLQWILSLRTNLEEEWNEHVDSLSVLPITNGLPLVATLRTGGNIPLASQQISPIVTSGDDEQPECCGEKVDVLVRLGLLKLASGIEGLTVDTVPETVKLNALRLRDVQSQLQNIIVISTSMLVFRQILVSESLASSPSELENIISESFRRLSELLDHVENVGIQEIVEAVVGSSSDTNLQDRKEVMMRLLTKSLQKDDAVFMRVSRSTYVATRGVVLGGSGVRGRKLADAVLRRVGAGMLLDRVVKTAEGLVVMANVSACVHGPWYRSLL